MKKRVITGVILAIILVPLIFVDSLFPLLQAVIMLFCVIATLEMIGMCEKQRKIKLPVKVLIIVSTLLIYLGIVNEDPACSSSLISQLTNRVAFKLTLITTITISCALIFACQVFSKDFNAVDVGSCLMIVLYVALSFSSLTILLFNGMRFIIYLLVICIVTDVFAYVFGSKFGKHKMAPHISPKKTWEGAMGGTIMATLAGSFFAIFYDKFGHFFVSGSQPIKFFAGVFDFSNFPPYVMGFILVLLSFTLSIFSQIGDLVASKFKRTYEIKDFSQVFPGHGGILDRFDSFLFSSIIFLCFITVVRVAMPLMQG